MQLPEYMDEVTPAWLQQAVGDHPAFRGKRIVSLHGTLVGEGIGQMSAIARLELGYDGEPGPRSVVVKLHTPFQAMRNVGLRYDMFVRETAFYQTLAADVTVPIPTIYFVAWDGPTQRNAMVMQDMSAWHWPDQVTGATQHQAEACIDALAKLGARHWGADFSSYPWLPDSQQPVLKQLAEDYGHVVPLTLERLGEFLSPAQRAAAERIARNMSWICEEIAKPPQILTHYDSRLENFVFRDKASRELTLIDWQLVARLRPGWDIGYFFGTSLTETDRRSWQDALIERYVEGLRQSGVRDYGADRFATDFRLGTMAMTIIPIIGGAAFDIDNERSKTLFGTMLRRAMASVVENECLALLPA
ncbi:MAG: oxidoreductase family protein [Micropepsaceae bacterium]